MRLTSLHIEQFRSYERCTVSFDSGSHLLLGANGAGKTNVLEAVSILSLSRSFLGADDTDVLRWGGVYFRLKAEAHLDDGTPVSVEVAMQTEPRKRKACFVNDCACSVGDLVGRIPTVPFLPEDLDLFRGPPAARRQLLDRLLSQVSPEYLRTLAVYQRSLKQRNALLRRISAGSASSDDLAVWDDHVARDGAVIVVRRLELLEMFQCALPQELQELGESWGNAVLLYDRGHGRERSMDAVAAELRADFLRTRDRDVLLQSTTTGPHRHDWRIEVDGRSIAHFASRGQQRTALLALLFLQVAYVQLQRSERPVILLDDVFSELDDAHQEALLAALAEHQVFLTATHAPPGIPDDMHLWNVSEGTLHRRPVARASASR